MAKRLVAMLVLLVVLAMGSVAFAGPPANPRAEFGLNKAGFGGDEVVSPQGGLGHGRYLF